MGDKFQYTQWIMSVKLAGGFQSFNSVHAPDMLLRCADLVDFCAGPVTESLEVHPKTQFGL
jgi:hypothetical protein